MKRLIKSDVIEQQLENVYDHQKFNYSQDNINVDILKEYFPETCFKSVCYRTILLNKDNINFDDIEKSILSNIYKNNIESWTLNENIAKKWERHFSNNKIKVILKSNSYGLFLPLLWKKSKEKYPQYFEHNFKDTDKFNKEYEFLVENSENIEIYDYEIKGDEE